MISELDSCVSLTLESFSCVQLNNKKEMMYWGAEMWLLSLLQCFIIDEKYSLEASTGSLIPKKERHIDKVQGDK
jgi:hypothetical protein